jgi:hypothetical protein
MEENQKHGGRRSQLYEHHSTPTTKLLKTLAEKSQARVISLTRTPPGRSSSRDSNGIGSVEEGGASDIGDNDRSYNQAALVRELTEKLRDSEFKIAGLELARELDAQQRARLETMMNELENSMSNLHFGDQRNSVWKSTQNQSSLARVALRELDSLRRELSSIGSRDSDRMSQIKQMNYVNSGLDAMGYKDDMNISDLRKDLAFFKPLLREELAYTIDELVLLNERLHVSIIIMYFVVCIFMPLNYWIILLTFIYSIYIPLPLLKKLSLSNHKCWVEQLKLEIVLEHQQDGNTLHRYVLRQLEE